ncbi:MAG: endonuclease/exonuclease/phosphatase family protein [Bacteroidota bacterium]
MRSSLRLLLIISLAFVACRSTQSSSKEIETYTLAFYNVENLFDTIDDPEKIDEDFTPEGRYKWTEEILAQKLDNIARVIAGMGKDGPAMLGLAEVEHRSLVQRLIDQPQLAPKKYEIVHAESPDMRGIDCAFIFDPAIFTLDQFRAFEMKFDEEPDYTSRRILWVSGTIGKERLHLVVNHWPSRYGGLEKSEPRRMTVANQVRAIIDSVQQAEPNAAIVMMGDFNDDPFNKSIVEGIKAGDSWPLAEGQDFYNPLYKLHQKDSVGTLTYRGKWNLFDQFLLSDDLLAGKRNLQYQTGSANIYRPEMIQVGGDGPAKDMPRRAIYRGEFQERGFSDHFPVYLRLQIMP